MLVHARALLTCTPEGACDFIDADLHDPDAIIDAARATLDFTRAIAVMMLGVVHHITDTTTACAIVQRLARCAGAGQLPGDQPRHQRRAASWPARKALTHFADNRRHDDPWAGDRYRRAHNRGKRYLQAVRIVGRGWLRIIYACFRNGTPYEPTVHHARHVATTA